ncbi:MAG TPA: DUF983 domain-containing protein [Alphaproteobacteria bacterium]
MVGRQLRGAISPLSAALRRRCPRCGEGRLFAGYLTVAERCEVCDLDLRRQDTGDGPAVFVILLLGFIIVGLALAVEVRVAPPYWLHLILWLPLTIGLALVMLPPLKAWLIAQHYRHDLLDDRPGA